MSFEENTQTHDQVVDVLRRPDVSLAVDVEVVVELVVVAGHVAAGLGRKTVQGGLGEAGGGQKEG